MLDTETLVLEQKWENLNMMISIWNYPETPMWLHWQRDRQMVRVNWSPGRSLALWHMLSGSFGAAAAAVSQYEKCFDDECSAVHTLECHGPKGGVLQRFFMWSLSSPTRPTEDLFLICPIICLLNIKLESQSDNFNLAWRLEVASLA